MKNNTHDKKTRRLKARKDQVKGGECFNIKRCDVAKSDSHNERTGPISNENIRLNMTPNNYVWKDPEVPSLPEHLERIKEDFSQAKRIMKKNGKEIIYTRALPANGSTQGAAIKESILVLPKDGKNLEEIVRKVVQRIAEKTRMRPIRIYIHLDELFTDPDTGVITNNPHAHIVWDAYDWDCHEIIKNKAPTMRWMQDVAMEETGMPRGTDARESGATHKNVSAYKAQKERERCQMLTARRESLENEVKGLEEQKKVIGKSIQRLYQDTQSVARMSLNLSKSLSLQSKLSPEEEDLRSGIEKLEYSETANDMGVVLLFISLVQKLIQITIEKFKALQTLSETMLRKNYYLMLGYKGLSKLVPEKAAKELTTIGEMKQQLEKAISEKEQKANELEQLKKQIPKIEKTAYAKGAEHQQDKWNEWYQTYHDPLEREYNRFVKIIKENHLEKLFYDNAKGKGMGLKR